LVLAGGFTVGREDGVEIFGDVVLGPDPDDELD